MGVSPEDFDYISKLVREEIGIVLGAGKEYLVETRLGPIASSEGFDGLNDFVANLKSDRRSPLKQKVLDAMTTNETLFFRDAKPFEALKLSILPALKEARSGSRSLKIWSAASSSGQEPYSIAIMIRENFPEMKSWDIQIKGTDICSQVIGKARDGIYTQFEVNRGLPAPLLMKYFSRKGMKWQLCDDIMNMVDFSEMNLLGSWSTLPVCDVVLMRNVLIYFDENTKRSLLSKVKSKLVSDGYFFVGGSETVGNLDDSFVREVYQDAQVYRLSGK